MSRRNQSPIRPSDISDSVKTREVVHVNVDEDGNETGRRTETVQADSAWALIIGQRKHFINADDTQALFDAINAVDETAQTGADVARLIKIDPHTARPKWGSDHSPHMIRATQLARIRAAGLIREG